jgi:predicted P-loop ATPase
MTILQFPEVPAWLSRYYERGFKLVYYPTKTKAPTDSDWPNKVYGPETYNGQNIGAILGVELSAGRFLADIDFDWVPGIPLSPGILPKTGCGFGHPPSKPISHAFYTTPTPVTTITYTNITYDQDDKTEHIAPSKQTFVEMRGLRENGQLGFQTMIPPSVWAPKGQPEHPGEKLEYRIDTELGHTDELPRRTLLYAIACLLHANTPYGGFKHEMRLACAGYFLTNGFTREETAVIMGSVLKQNGPHDKGDEVTAIDSTVRAINAKHRVAGRTKLAECMGRYGDRVLQQLTKWVGGSEFIESKGKIIPNQENIRRAMDLVGARFTYDEFANKPLIFYNNGHVYDGEFEDNVRTQMWLEVDTKYRFLPPKQLFLDVTSNMAWENRFHPVMDYLVPLVWDGIPRISTWVSRSSGAEDSDYTRAVSEIMLMAAVRRVTEPGCKYDEMVIFESGKQGLMKSTALRTLCPNDNWFSDNLPLNLKAQELIELTAGKWIVEVGELNKLKSAQIEHIKALLSRQEDTARLAYRHDPKTQRRQCIFVGTTNSFSYLTDKTGNRRFWPIRVGKFDIEWILKNRDQLWAEAYARERKGESIRLPESLYLAAEAQQEHRLVDDDWHVILDSYFEKQHQRVAYDEIWEQLAVPVERRTSVVTQRIAEVMQALGFTKASTVRNRQGKVSKGWKRERMYDDIEWQSKRSIKPEDENPEDMPLTEDEKGDIEKL